MKITLCSFILLMLASLDIFAQSSTTPKPPQSLSPAQPAQQITPDAGERAFAANCSRCHNPPEQINTRITGAVIRHMRVRANLSAADERALLRFFNP